VDALDAAHLYSYAKDSNHHEHGGLLLRKDLHRLFDVGLLAVHPETRKISATGLDQYPDYARLESSVLHVDLHPAQMKWIQDHWNEHRPGS
jgi:hypothetical protein